MGGSFLMQTTYIHRLNTDGGAKPTGACEVYGAIKFVPYTTDYYFYRLANLSSTLPVAFQASAPEAQFFFAGRTCQFVNMLHAAGY